MISLTPEQTRVKRFIERYSRRHGSVPNYSEIAQGCDLSSKGTAWYAVARLIERGHARRTGEGERNYELVHAAISRAPDGAPLYFVPVGGI